MQTEAMRFFSKTSVVSVFLTIVATVVTAQEYILPLKNNPQLLNSDQPPVKKAAAEGLLELPLSDDFSYNSAYPSPAIWADNYAYINNGYAVNPPTIGVATMDALDQNGSVYPFATVAPETFDADLLTSHPINLRYPTSDSIYLSFFYQPQGNGLMPLPHDSLYLDFYDPAAEQWINVWGVPGTTLSAFRQVMIPIRDTLYLKEGFRFGFRNRASLPKNTDYRDKWGNVDHWNIDYVRLDRNRNIADTIIRDVAFYKPIPSLLKDYESIPWDHFGVAYNTIYLPKVTLNYFNNDSAIRNVTRRASIYDEVWDNLYGPDNSSIQDILPKTSVSHDISTTYPFNFARGDTASYLIKAWLSTDAFDNKQNDTIIRRQLFRDYFAYDDGTAERAYGLRGQGSGNGMFAVRFNSFIVDELGGVDIYFTQLKDSLNLGYYYKFMVWDDNNGVPGNIIYEDEPDYAVEYADSLNRFIRYEFKETVGISGTFYVGLLQYNQFLLNVGMDINKPATGNLFYNLGNEWQPSAAPGSLMLRPFVMRSYSTDGNRNSEITDLRIGPNPAGDYLFIEPSPEAAATRIQLSVYDITGRVVDSYGEVGREVFTGHLPEGVYLFKFTSDKFHFKTERIIIKR
jgi:hypothetical protein